MATENYCGLAANVRRKRPVIAPASISNLGDDLLLNVLIRLPNPKSAFRSKSVCKRWNSLISAPYFLRRFVSHHRILSAGEPPLLIHSESNESFLPVEIRSSSLVLGCFKDLLLLGVKEMPCDDKSESGRRFLVCNPFTKQWVALPLAPPMRRLRYFGNWTATLACEPCNSIILDLGDGEEITHNPDYRFRVVRIYETEDDVIMDVFCSNSIEWTKVALDRVYRPPLSFWRRQLHGNVVWSNGKLYWMTWRTKIVGWNPLSPENNPTLIDCPLGSNRFCTIWVSRGALYMMMIKANGILKYGPASNVNNVFTFWRLEEGEGWWKRDYQVSMKKLMRAIIIDEHGCEIKCSKLEGLVVVGQHLQKPEVIYMQGRMPDRRDLVILSCNLMTEELEFLAYEKDFIFVERVCQTGIDFWPTAIPNYERLRELELASTNESIIL